MSTKKIVGLSVSAVVVIFVILLVIMASGLGGEASKLDSMLKQDVTTHVSMDEVKKQLTEMGYTIGAGSETEINATGPHHSAIVYSSWLVVNVTAGPDGKATAEHFDRASSIF